MLLYCCTIKALGKAAFQLPAAAAFPVQPTVHNAVVMSCIIKLVYELPVQTFFSIIFMI